MTTKEDRPKRTRARKPKQAAPPPDAADVAAGAASEPAPGPEPPVSPARSIPPPPTAEEREQRFSELSQVVAFRMDAQRYALPIESVQEIQQIVAISDMPGSSGAVLGVINLRGRVIPAIAMRGLVGLPPREPDLETPMILAYTAQGLVALIVDEVEDVLEVPPGSMQAPSSVHALADRLLGVCTLDDGLVFVLDMDRVVPADIIAGVVT